VIDDEEADGEEAGEMGKEGLAKMAGRTGILIMADVNRLATVATERPAT
jgi:hypothetical protein